jgi:signal peptidase I
MVAYDKYYLRKRISDSGVQTNAALNTIIDYSRSFFPVLLFVLVIRSFIFEPFRIPSGSMMPTLLQGDYIFVKKYSFGLRLPVLDKKIVETGEPERGDVVVFRLPSEPSINYIKRVIGLPGDELVYVSQSRETQILRSNNSVTGSTRFLSPIPAIRCAMANIRFRMTTIS